MNKTNFNSANEFWEYLAILPPQERYKAIQNETNRNLITRRGTSCLLYTKTPNNEIQVVMIHRQKKGQSDGYGSFGGIGEKEDIKNLGFLDPKKTYPLGIEETEIRINNFLRELKEELADLGIDVSAADFPVKKQDFINIGLATDERDDDFLVFKWNKDLAPFDGKNVGYAINSVCLMQEIAPEKMEKLFTYIQNPKPNGEIARFESIPLKDALAKYLKTPNENGIMQEGYRYGHEYFSLWILASKEIFSKTPNPDASFEKMLQEVEVQSERKIDFALIAAKMLGIDNTFPEYSRFIDEKLDEMAFHMGINPETLKTHSSLKTVNAKKVGQKKGPGEIPQNGL